MDALEVVVQHCGIASSMLDNCESILRLSLCSKRLLKFVPQDGLVDRHARRTRIRDSPVHDGWEPDVLADMRASGLLTLECGEAWYIRCFRSEDARFKALRHLGVFKASKTPEWCAATFKGRDFQAAMRLCGNDVKALSKEWYVEHMGPDEFDVIRALRQANLIDSSVGVEWYCANFRLGLYEVLKDAGLLRDKSHSWLGARTAGRSLLRCLQDTGQLRPEYGKEWYAAHMDGEVLREALLSTGLT